uniref:Secreted protein n=1 Tax=Plectus sambesii TaxID=2011161 RepID=A0A914UN11_9BILA
MRTIFTSLLVIYAVDWLVSAVRIRNQSHRIRHARHNQRRTVADSHIYDGRSFQQTPRVVQEERTVFERTTWTEEEYREHEPRSKRLIDRGLIHAHHGGRRRRGASGPSWSLNPTDHLLLAQLNSAEMALLELSF